MPDAFVLPPGRAPGMVLDRDAVVKRLLMVVIGLYLVIALALPLGVMLAKSFGTWRFDLTRFEMQVGDGAGNWGPVETAAVIAGRVGLDPTALRPSSESRLEATKLFPDFSFRGPEHYRLRAAAPGAVWLVGLDRISTAEWQDYDSNTFRRVMLRPAMGWGVDNYLTYFTNPVLFASVRNSLVVALVSTAITVGLAFGFAYALTRTCMRWKGMFRTIAAMPILVPSLLPGIALVYLFGQQGWLRGALMGQSIYGPLGIVIGSVFFTFPHALIILTTALSMADQRHYEAAAALRASPWRTFRTVTLPGARYGLISAGFVVFTLVITDFGLPKVIGGQYSVLAVDIYKQVIGQQNFEMGAVVSVLLLIPAVLAFAVDRWVQKKQVSVLSARSVPYAPRPDARRDRAALAWCGLIAVFILGIIAMCQVAALVKFWPYDLSLTLRNFDFGAKGGGWRAWVNSVELAALTAVIGTGVIFLGAYLSEKTEGFAFGRGLFHLLAMLPMAVPGLVLGLAYIFFFNDAANPLNPIYGTMVILVLSTVTHFYTVGHLTALTALKQIDREFEPVAASLRQPFHRLFFGVTVPVCMPAILDIAIYMFVNAMTTVSAVVFLYSTHTALAAIAVLNMDDAGDIASAAAMGMLIFYTNVAARLAHGALSRRLDRSAMAWRRR
ncbi:putative 2-aminoethylphosphonate ABC transporter permease subunit [Paenirhodobacter sp.]|uniref:putative 2-aminoethylphosphonate ABC transporter permease subunit n=1 Tax=Paenirhodobacter sp. TaxID=1965326 RepID=UPI003B3C3832